jgi:hypothetical protein
MGFALGTSNSCRWLSRFRHDRAPVHPRDAFHWVVVHAGLLIAAAFFLALNVGCGGQDRLPVNPVRGRVEYQGRGIPGAVVIFHPQEGADEKAKKMRPFAYADGEGNFELKTYVDGDGAPPGTYRVSIVAASGGPAVDRGAATSAGGQESALSSSVRIPPQITEKYRSVDSSGIQVTIHDGENNLEPFAL